MCSGRFCRNKCCRSSRPTEVSRVLWSDGAPQRVTLSSRPGVGVSPPPPPPPPVPSAVCRKQEKPALGSALIHGETLLWSANITAKQVKYRVILCVSWRVSPHCLDRCASTSYRTLTFVDTAATGVAVNKQFLILTYSLFNRFRGNTLQ